MKYPEELSPGDMPEVLREYVEGKQDEPLRSMEAYSLPVRKILHEFQKIAKWNAVKIVRPHNLKTEREHFLKDMGMHEPNFEYLSEEYNVSLQRNFLEELQERCRELQEQSPVSEQESSVLQALPLALEHRLALCEIIEGIQHLDEKQIRKGMEQRYPRLDPLLVQDAQREYERLRQEDPFPRLGKGKLSLQEISRLEEMQCDAQKIQEGFSWMLEQYGLLKQSEGDDGKYQISISDDVTSIDVRPRGKEGPEIVIPKHRIVSGKKLLLLCAHEIEAHVLQNANSRELFGDADIAFDLGDESFKEGLALMREDEFLRTYFGETRRPLPFRVLAIAKAESGASFSEVFHDQVQLLQGIDSVKWRQFFTQWYSERSEEENCMLEAWHTTYRVMRGHVDMTNPESFAFGKDSAYFRGFRLLEHLRRLEQTPVIQGSLAAPDVVRLLAPFSLQEEDLPYRFQDKTGEYVQILLK